MKGELDVKNVFIFGLAGSGKDTFANYLKNLTGSVSAALADGVRFEYTKFTGSYNYRENREMLIKIGEGYKQIYGQDVWCDLLIRKYAEIKTIPPLIVTDGRYEHEYEYFVELGFVPVRIVADAHMRIPRMKKRGDVIDLNALAFERQNMIPDHFPAYEIVNNGTEQELLEQAQELVPFLRCGNE